MPTRQPRMQPVVQIRVLDIHYKISSLQRKQTEFWKAMEHGSRVKTVMALMPPEEDHGLVPAQLASSVSYRSPFAKTAVPEEAPPSLSFYQLEFVWTSELALPQGLTCLKVEGCSDRGVICSTARLWRWHIITNIFMSDRDSMISSQWHLTDAQKSSCWVLQGVPSPQSLNTASL